MKTRCVECGKDFDNSPQYRKICSDECRKKRQTQYMKEYNQSDKYKTSQKKHRQTDKFKENRRKYRQSEKYKQSTRKYQQSEKYKTSQKRYRDKKRSEAAYMQQFGGTK